jgi:hypothetical protein
MLRLRFGGGEISLFWQNCCKIVMVGVSSAEEVVDNSQQKGGKNLTLRRTIRAIRIFRGLILCDLRVLA